MKRLLSLLVALALVPFTAYADADHPRVRMNTTMGDIVIELDRAKAPKTVENFLRYAQDDFYDGTIFHRVIDGFVVQGGGLTPDLRQKPTRPPIPNEANNGLSNVTGTIAMARTMDPHSASAQFFINLADNVPLDHREPTARGWGYAVFGRVVQGMDVVTKIAKTPTGAMDVPVTPVVIKDVVLESGAKQ